MSPSIQSQSGQSQSAESARVAEKFDSPAEAARYSSEFDTHRQQRSRQTLMQIFASVPAGSSVLDLPCGSGRLVPLLTGLGYRYTGADVSAHMVQAAAEKWRLLREAEGLDDSARFAIGDVMSLSYADDEFDAVICNRLFHHYTRGDSRITALAELGRVCRGPVIVFFLDTWTLMGMRFHLKQSLHKEKKRMPVSVTEFRANGIKAGLEMVEVRHTRGRYNKEAYAVFRRQR